MLNGAFFSLEYRGVGLKAEVYMGDFLGLRKMNATCGKMMHMGPMNRGYSLCFLQHCTFCSVTQNLCHKAFAHIFCIFDYYSESVRHLQQIDFCVLVDVPFLSHDHP
jgi:hypothetical protein